MEEEVVTQTEQTEETKGIQHLTQKRNAVENWTG